MQSHARMGNNGRNHHDDNNRDRIFDDRDEGNRSGDRNFDRSIDRGGMGQSGYAAGRDIRDSATGAYNRNQGIGDRTYSSNQDDRFTGRGGDDYRMNERGNDRSGYRYINEEQNDRGWNGQSIHGDYGASESQRGVWQGDIRSARRGWNEQGTGGYGPSSSSRELDRMDRSFDRGYGQNGYSQNYGRNPGQGGTNQPYNQSQNRGTDDRGFGSMGGQSYGGNYGGTYGGQSEQGFRGGSYGQHSDNRPFGQAANPMGLHRGKGPQGWTRSDERIKDLVCEALTDHEHIDASGIDVDVKNGDVTLTGMVPDRDTKRAAEDCAERIAGVNDVQNQLKVSSDERMRMGRSTQMAKGNTGGATTMASNPGIENGSSSKDKKAQA